MKKLIHGVGINDAGYVVKISERRNEEDKLKQVVTWRCPFHKTWENMLKRCYNPRFQSLNPTYIGCIVTEEWLIFSNFRSWMEKQNWEGMQLDKDILVAGNKVYSPDTCAFIPQTLNCVLGDSRASRGAWPLGVRYRPNKYKKKPYEAFVSMVGKNTYIGIFSTPEEAHAAWQLAKIKAIKSMFAEWENPDPRVGPAIDRIVAKLQDDLDNGRETISFLE